MPPVRCTHRLHRFRLGSLLGLAVLVLLHPTPLRADPELPTATPSPLPGAIVIEAADLPFLEARPEDDIHVFAVRGNARAAIPFQVATRDRKDRWVIARGTRPTQDDRPGLFDANDAVVFLRRDLGGKAGALPFPPGITGWHEVRLGPAAVPDGFVYIGLGDATPRPAAPLVRYDPAQDRIYAERYTVGFDAPLPSHVAFVDRLGEYGRNLISQSSFMGEVGFLGNLITVRRTQDDLDYQVRGYSRGAVRLTRRTRYWLSLPLGLRAKGRVDLLCYPDFVEGTARVRLKIAPRYVLADGWLRTAFDFLDFGDTGVVQPNAAENGRLAEGGETQRWAALQLPNGRTLLLATRLEGALQALDQQVYFSTAGRGRPTFGFRFSDFSALETGSYRLSLFAVVLDSHAPAVVRSTAAFFLSPPSVTVTPVRKVK